MIYIKLEDTIIDIIEKIEETAQNKMALYFPVWHPILHNYISLKIIKSKTLKHDITIHTNDIVWRKVVKKVGIKLSKEKNKESDSPQTIMLHNFTVRQYTKYLFKKYKEEIKVYFSTNRKINNISQHSRRSFENSSLKFLSFILFLSIVIFVIVYYIGISKTYVYISPETKIKKELLNFMLDTEKSSSILGNNNNIQLSRISEKFYSSHSYPATEILEDLSSTAWWFIEIENYTTSSLSLKPETRFMDSNGYIFRIKDWVKIPEWQIDNFWENIPGRAKIKVYADHKDSSGNTIWSKWNIKSWVKLIIPWLEEDFQKQIYAMTTENFSWWTNIFTKIISQNDIDEWKIAFEEKLKSEAFENLKKKIQDQNTQNNTQIKILSWNNTIYYWDTNISLEQDITAGINKESFTYSWNITIYAYTYNSSSILQKLNTIINEKKLDGIEKIKEINPLSLRLVEIISSENSGSRVKATFEIEALYYYNIWWEQNAYTSSLKSKIRWVDIDKAENLLINDPNISRVEIKNRPFFIKKVSSILNNIIIKVQL